MRRRSAAMASRARVSAFSLTSSSWRAAFQSAGDTIGGVSNARSRLMAYSGVRSLSSCKRELTKGDCMMQVPWYDTCVLGRTYDAEVCSIARALEVVGERWSLLIIRDALFAGSTRYTDFQRRLGIATNTLRD